MAVRKGWYGSQEGVVWQSGGVDDFISLSSCWCPSPASGQNDWTPVRAVTCCRPTSRLQKARVLVRMTNRNRTRKMHLPIEGGRILVPCRVLPSVGEYIFLVLYFSILGKAK